MRSLDAIETAPADPAFSTRAGRQLGFSQLGLGGAPLGNLGRVVGETEADATLSAAWSAGVRYFDTAPLYGHGRSEMRMGHFLAGRPAGDFIVSTKVGRLLTPCRPGEEESGLYLDPPPFRVSFDYSYDGVMRSLDESLKRLGLDRVDILYVHDVDARTHGGAEGSQARIAELMECGGWRALDRLRASGAVGAVGAGVNETAPCQRLLEVADPDLFLLAGRYTLLEQEPLETLFPACARRGVGIIIGGPYNSGILARAGGSFDYAPAPAEVTRRVARLEAVCARFGASLASAALQFAAAHPIVASVIPGAQNPSEVEANAALMDVPIPVGLWSALKSEGLLAPAAPTPDREARATC